MTITVVIPTCNNRHDYLRRCLQSLEMQERKADCILIVAPKDDGLSREIAASSLRGPTSVIILDAPPGGVRTALNLAFDHCKTDIMILTDDDSEAYPNWLGLIEKRFSDDPLLGGVGGRDELQYSDRPELSQPAPTNNIGQLTAWGSLYGSHHQPPISSRLETDILKGVNMALRRKALADMRIDDALRGNFTQMGWELILSFKLRSRGWRLLFDQQLPIRHWVAPRASSDSRTSWQNKAGADTVYNTYYAVVRYAPISRSLLHAFRGIFIGGRIQPGLCSAIILTVEGDLEAWSRLRNQIPARLEGMWDGLCAWARDSHRLYFNWPTTLRAD